MLIESLTVHHDPPADEDSDAPVKGRPRSRRRRAVPYDHQPRRQRLEREAPAILRTAARELRDRYLEQVNAGLLSPGTDCAAKYDVSRPRELEERVHAAPGVWGGLQPPAGLWGRMTGAVQWRREAPTAQPVAEMQGSQNRGGSDSRRGFPAMRLQSVWNRSPTDGKGVEAITP